VCAPILVTSRCDVDFYICGDYGLGEPKGLSWRLSNTWRLISVWQPSRRSWQIRQPGNLNYRSRQPVHELRVHTGAQRRRVKISMDVRVVGGQFMVERLWRSLKYDCVYLHAFRLAAKQETHWRVDQRRTRSVPIFFSDTGRPMKHTGI